MQRRVTGWMAMVALVVVTSSVACGASAEDDGALEQARGYTERFYAGDLEALHARFTPDLAQEIPFAAFETMYRSVHEQLGRETEVVSETVEVKEPYHRYLRRARFERFAGVIEINWVLREDRSIAGVVFRPVEESSPPSGS